MPECVPLQAAQYIFIPTYLFTQELRTKLLNFNLLDRVVLTKDESDTQRLQEEYFRNGKDPLQHGKLVNTDVIVICKSFFINRLYPFIKGEVSLLLAFNWAIVRG